MRDRYLFSNNQDLGSAVAATGVVSTDVFDMELEKAAGNTVLTDDQIEFFLNFKILSSTNTGGSGGMDVELRSSDINDIETSDQPIAKIHIKHDDIATGTMRSIKVLKSLAQKFLGVFYNPITSNLDNATVVDCWISAQPDGSPNEDIQKMPS